MKNTVGEIFFVLILVTGIILLFLWVRQDVKNKARDANAFRNLLTFILFILLLVYYIYHRLNLTMKTNFFTSILLFIGAAVSLMFPYIQRIGSVSESETALGIELFSTFFTLTPLMVAVIAINVMTDRTGLIIALSSSALGLLAAFYIVRDEIHWQGIDHHYDTRSGIGFYMLFGCTLAFVLLCSVQLARNLIRNQ